MTYTAAALTFLIQGVKMPVILTGSNLPITDKNTDSIKNIEDAIKIALKKKEELKGVFLSFAGSSKGQSFVHLGNRCRKIMAEPYSNNFESVNVTPIAKVSDGIFGKRIKMLNTQLLEQVSKKNSNRELKLYDKICSNVEVLKIYPGFNPQVELYKIKQANSKGVILEIYVSGTACVKPGKYSLIPFLEELRDRKIPIFLVSAEKGTIKTDIYGSSGELIKAGACPLGDMITEAAYTKLCWVLGHTDGYKQVVEKMKKNIAAEITAEKNKNLSGGE
jgi:L-asparaginase